MRLLLLLTLTLCLNSLAQNLEVDTYPKHPVKGDAISLVIASDERINLVEDFPDVEGWKSSRGISQQQRTINGVSSFYIIKQYMAEEVGEFTIPSFKVKVGGKIMNTPAREVKVIQNKAVDSEDKLIMTRMKYNGKDEIPENIYPGVIFTVDYEVHVARSWRYLDRDVLYDYRPQMFSEDLQIQTNRGFLSNRNFEEITTQTIIDGSAYNTTVYRYKMAPMKSGSYDFNIKQRIYALKKIPGIPRNKTHERDVNILKTIKVSPLPPPPNNVYFLEIAGKWDVDAKLTKSEAKTGHTFEMLVYVKGSDGDIERIKAPALNLPGFEVDPNPEVEHHALGAIIKYSMRALKKSSFPKITFATFNPLDEKFELFPIDLDIEISGEDINVDTGINKVISLPQDNQSSKPPLKIETISMVRPLHFNVSPLWFFISLALPLTYLSIIWFYRRAEMGQNVDLKQEAIDKLKTLCTKLEGSSDAEFFDKELLPYLAQAYDLPPGVTADELAAKIDDNELASLIQNSSHQSFLPGNQRQLNNSALANKLQKALLTLMIFFSFSLTADESAIHKSYENDDYFAVIDGYKSLIEKDNANPNYFYNLGLAQLNLERYPEALASFETASRLQPPDGEIRNKVIFVRNKLQVQKANDLFSVRDKLRPDQWLRVSMIVWAVFWVFLIFQLIRKIPGKRWTATAGGIITFLCLLAWFTQKSSTYKEGQYVVTKAMSIAENELKPGEEVLALSTKDEKIQINFRGKEIWIDKNKLAKVW